METLNTAFFFVTDLIVSIRIFFIGQAWNVGRFVLIISLSMAAINYAITGQGLKENLIKISKAVVFFVLVMSLYPRIMGFITETTFRWAHDSVFVHIDRHLAQTRQDVVAAADAPAPPERRRNFLGRFFESRRALPQDAVDTTDIFMNVIYRRETGGITYTVVAPAAILQIVMLVASEPLSFAREEGSGGIMSTDFFSLVMGSLVGIVVMFVGMFAVLEYLMAFLEFMLVASVGVILFPLSLWEGTKFLAEKLIGAIIGFFIKLLFCNITMFLMLFGYMSLLRGFADRPFTGQPDEILITLFISLIFFYLCRSAPGLAQSLLTGAPSLGKIRCAAFA